jgi:hypothetical protein
MVVSQGTRLACLIFFAEAKVSAGNLIVRKRQVPYDGTRGAHGMHALHSLTGRENALDGNAYMISAPDNGGDAGGLLSLHIHHGVSPNESNHLLDYSHDQAQNGT